MLDQILEGGLSVSRVAKTVKPAAAKKGGPKFTKKKIKDPNLLAKEEELEEVLGTDVSITDRGGKGTIAIHYYSSEEFHEILKRIAS